MRDERSRITSLQRVGTYRKSYVMSTENFYLSPPMRLLAGPLDLGGLVEIQVPQAPLAIKKSYIASTSRKEKRVSTFS